MGCPVLGTGQPASHQALLLCLSRPILPPLLSGEQLVPRHAGRPLSVYVPVRLAALLAVCVPRDTGSGEPSAPPRGSDLVLQFQTLLTILKVNVSLRTASAS